MRQERVQLESCVAACILLEGGNSHFHADLDLADFSYSSARAVIGCSREEGIVDPVLASAWAQKNGIKASVSDISEMINAVPTSKNLIYYVQQLKALVYRQKLHEIRLESVEKMKTADCLVSLAKEIEQKEAELSSRYLEENSDTDMAPVCAHMLCRIERQEDNPDLLPLNIPFLDDLFGGGLLPNELIIIAGRPGTGKTALALQIALECRRKVVFFSLEMSKKQVAARLLSAVAKTNTKIATRQPSQVPSAIRESLLNHSCELLMASERIVVFDKPDQTIEAIRRESRKQVERGAEMVIVDYLQLVEKQAQTRERAVAEISRSLKNLSKELGIPVICLCQMSRAIESEKRLPRLSDLRESGAIEQDANAVLFLHQTCTNTSSTAIKQIAQILAKGRDVGQGYRKSMFNPDHQRFYAMETSNAG